MCIQTKLFSAVTSPVIIHACFRKTTTTKPVSCQKGGWCRLCKENKKNTQGITVYHVGEFWGEGKSSGQSVMKKPVCFSVSVNLKQIVSCTLVFGPQRAEAL